MKKLITTIFALFAATMLFAAPTFTVKQIQGTATYESAPNKKTALKVGQELSATTYVEVSMSSQLIVTDENGKDITIPAMKRGKIDELTSQFAKGGKGIKKTPALSKMDTDVEGTTKSAKTAAEKAADFAEDEDWNE